MELEVGVRITRDAGDLSFASTETEAAFILAAHLPGFKRDEIELAINEEEKQIRVRGGGHIACQEAVITGRVAVTREVSVECFDESFHVPDSVDWGGVDASPLDHDTRTLEEVSGDEVEASGAEMNISTKVKKLSRRRRIHCRYGGRRPAFPIPPSTLLSGSAFVFSIMVLVFHFIKRKNPNY